MPKPERVTPILQASLHASPICAGCSRRFAARFCRPARLTITPVLSCAASAAKSTNCARPLMNDDRRLYLKDARHPLLEHNLRKTGGKIVPISLEMDEAHQTMVISGPNAGGKTVVLKTVGLIALMAQMGLHVPVTDA